MRKFFSTKYTSLSFDISLFLMRLGFGGLLFMNHGLGKMLRFSERKDSFSDPFGIGSLPSMLLVIFAEVFCAILLVMGLMTRFAAFVLVILFLTIILIVHAKDPVKEKEDALLFLLAFLAILLVGPGRWSLDKLIGK